MDLRVAKDNSELAHIAAGIFKDICLSAIKQKGNCSVVLSGGGTPRALYKTLATPPYSTEIPWGKVHLFWGDERCVKPESSESNYKFAFNTLINRINIPAENVHRMEGELSPKEAATGYLKTLKDFFKDDKHTAFDLVLLGLGTDGHT